MGYTKLTSMRMIDTTYSAIIHDLWVWAMMISAEVLFVPFVDLTFPFSLVGARYRYNRISSGMRFEFYLELKPGRIVSHGFQWTVALLKPPAIVSITFK